MNRKWLASAALFAGLLSAERASASDRILVLEVLINGRTTGRVAEFIDRDGTLLVRPSDLAELGLAVPAGLPADSEPIAMSSLANLRAQVDEARQTLVIAASDAALRVTQLDVAPFPKVTPLTPAQIGALLNYDAAVTYSDNRASGGALVDLRLFGPYGVIESSALLSIAPAGDQRKVARLDTTYTFTQPGKLRRWRLGDVVTGALPWTRAVRLGGGQVASDFGLRPDLVTYPLPQIGASAAVPSTVNVMVNGIQQLSESVDQGPFAIRTLPVVSGAGDVSVTVTDALGQRTLMTLPFYSSSALLTPGLASYSFELGWVREDYGLSSDRYSGWAANQSSRLGVTDKLTLESHAEATAGLALLGVGATVLAGTLGIVNVAVAGSVRKDDSDGPPSGAMIAAGFQRISNRFNVTVSGTYATRGFRDIAASHGAAVPKSTLNASLGYQAGALGSFGLAYSRRNSWPAQADEPAEHLLGDASAPTIELVTGSYSVRIAELASLHATGFKDLRSDSYGAGVGLSFELGNGTFGSLEGSVDGGRSSYSVNMAKAAQAQGDFGYRLRVSEGSAPHRSAEGEFLGSWGRVSAGLDQFSGQIAGRATARGALVLAGGELFASEMISDSFAVVSTGDVPGVPVMYENRLVGRSNAHGKLLIPSLRSFEDNRLSIDSRLLPPDIEVDRTTANVRPPDRSGVAVDFGVRKMNAALVVLHDSAGRPIPLGSIASVEGAADRPVGHDGETYLTGLKPSNRVAVALPDGTSCVVQFNYRPVSGDIPLLGPERCS